MSIVSYRKKFTALWGLQSPRTLEYSLLGGEGEDLRILISERMADGDERTSLTAVSGDRSGARDLLTYLYENAVPFDQAADVITDAWSVLGRRQGERHGSCCDPTAHCG